MINQKGKAAFGGGGLSMGFVAGQATFWTPAETSCFHLHCTPNRHFLSN